YSSVAKFRLESVEDADDVVPRSAVTTKSRLDRIGTNHRYRRHARAQRQKCLLIFQQHNRLPCRLQGQGSMLGSSIPECCTVRINEGVLEQTQLEFCSQHSSNCRIDCCI